MPLFLKIHARVLRDMGYHDGNLFSNGSKKGKKQCVHVLGGGVYRKREQEGEREAGRERMIKLMW